MKKKVRIREKSKWSMFEASKNQQKHATPLPITFSLKMERATNSVPEWTA